MKGITFAASCTFVGAGIIGGIFSLPEGKPRSPVTCQEDEPCWDCQTMGNHVCGPNPLIAVKGELYELRAPNRPGCFVEPSNTVDGFEIILYPDIAAVNSADLGFEVPCP